LLFVQGLFRLCTRLVEKGKPWACTRPRGGRAVPRRATHKNTSANVSAGRKYASVYARLRRCWLPAVKHDNCGDAPPWGLDAANRYTASLVGLPSACVGPVFGHPFFLMVLFFVRRFGELLPEESSSRPSMWVLPVVLWETPAA